MTQTQKKPTNPKKTQSQPPSSSSSSPSRTGMKLIVPLQAVVQGRNGFLLGSLIPLSLFYFLQLYLKRRRPENNNNNNTPSSPTLLPRSSSRSNLSSRGSISSVKVSKLANVVAKRDDSLYYVGIERVEKDPYHVKFNPHGIIQLGLSDNKLSLDLIEKWLVKNLEGSMMGNEDINLSINGIAPYQSFHGLNELKIALADFMHQVMGGSVEFDPSNMVLTSGATPAIEILSFCLADHGNAFLVPTPYYPGFDRDVRWRPGIDLIPVHCRSTDNFNLNITALEQAFSQARKRGVKVRGILISNPSNPVGNILTPEMLFSLLDFAEDKNIHIIADEVFAGSTYGSEEFVSIAEVLDSEYIDKSRVHIVYGLSKDLSIAGFRVGVIHSHNKTVLDAAKKMSRFSSISAPTQRLVTSMLSDKRFIQEYIETNRNRIRRVHDEFVDCLTKLGIKCAKSSAGMFCWADMSGLIRPYSEKGELELWEKFMSVGISLHFIVSLFPRLLPLFSSIPNLILLCSSVVDNKMVGSADVLVNGLSTNGAVELLPDDFDVSAIIKDPVPPVVADNGIDKEEAKTNGGKEKREIVLGRNIHTTCLEVTEPEADDEITGDRDAHMASVLARYRKSLTERTKYHLGYPYNLDFDYGALSQLQHFSINNLGDPFIESNYGVHSRQFEVGVLDWFARLWELEKNEYWGYITNCGTEGNLHGILVGREVLPDGILYASRESHYSIFKAARMYRMECEKVETLNSGEIDCDDFKAKLLRHQDKPAIINVNIGTTVKGAVDDLDLVIQKLEEAGFSHDRFYIHVDGALFGLMMPFVKRAPKVTFKKPIGSVSVSGHKFVGCPMPCGVQITRLEHINALSRNVEYLASRDATIMGSRNGHAPIFLWYTLNRKGYRGFQKEVQKCLRNAHYFKDRLIEAGIGAMLNELSSTVVFERPHDEEFIRKWQLACKGNIAHVVVMPNVTIEKLDDFLNELVQKRATWFEDGTFQPYCIASDVGENSCLCALHK